jgi:hypothetical protein
VDSKLFKEHEDIIINKSIAALVQLKMVQKQAGEYNNPLITIYLHKAIENVRLMLDTFKNLQKEFYEGIDG